MPDATDTPPQSAEYRDPEPFSIAAAGMELDFYPNGRARLAALLELIGSAQHSLKLAFYIFARDQTGQKVRDALAEAALRGVEVTLILDGFGADADADFLEPLISAGGRFLSFSPRWNVRYLIRNHQKIVIADSQIGMIGGFNIENSYFAPPSPDGWNDLGIRISGAQVAGLVQWFARLEEWTGDPRSQLLSIRRVVRAWDPGEGPVQWLVGGPTRWLNSWARRVFEDIEGASQIDMMMAYFSPRRRITRQIGNAAQRGDVRLMLAGKSDNTATIGAARALYGRLLRRGVRIFEFQPSMLHTKLIVIDDAVYLGSANFDMRSLYLNLELMLRIEDAALADRMRAFIAFHQPASLEITRKEHRARRTAWKRIRWSLCWFLVTVVDYTVTRRLNLGLKP